MTRGFAVVLTLLVLGAAFFTAWFSNQRTDFFPSRFVSEWVSCEHRSGEQHSQPVMDDFVDGWFSAELSAFQEPSLYHRPVSTPLSVRFTFLRSFHDPIVVRVDTLPDGQRRLSAKQRVAGVVFGSEKPSDRALVRMLSSAESGAFDAVLERSRIFDKPSRGCAGGLDGSQWIVEAADPAKGYRYRQKWSPEDGLERELGLFMLGLTGWDIEPIY